MEVSRYGSKESFSTQTNAPVNIRELYGGDLILLPGDTNEGRWHRPDWINKLIPGLTREEAVYTAGINYCYSTIRNLFQASSGYEKILVAVGDHELGEFYSSKKKGNSYILIEGLIYRSSVHGS